VGDEREGHVAQAGVLVVADVVLNAGAGAVLDVRDVLAALVGEDRLEAVAVVVGEAQLAGGGRARGGRSRATRLASP